MSADPGRSLRLVDLLCSYGIIKNAKRMYSSYSEYSTERQEGNEERASLAFLDSTHAGASREDLMGY